MLYPEPQGDRGGAPLRIKDARHPRTGPHVRKLRILCAWLAMGSAGVTACAGPGSNPAGSDWNRSVPDAPPTAAAVAGDNWAVHGSAGAPEAVKNAQPSAPVTQDEPVALHATLGRASGRGTLLLKVDYAVTAPARADRPPLNVALVLDSSASMAEARKLPYTLDAARWVIENLARRDSIAMVAFNDTATVLSGAGGAVNKPFLYHRLDEITPQNYTNLSAGLLEGIAQVGVHGAEGQVRQVFLLTDGQANRGETDPAALRRIVQEAKARGIGVSTFGVGGDFNESLIASMAAAGGGRYTYVKSPEQIPTAFKDELHGLLQVVAQNVTLEVSVADGEISKVYGQLRDDAVASTRVVIGDLRVTESGFFLAELRPLRPGSALGADVRLVYDDPQIGKRVRRAVNLQVSAGAQFEDESTAVLAAVLDAVERADSAAQGLDVELYRQAQASFDQLYPRARELALRNRDQNLLNQTFVLKHFMGELAAAEQEGLLHGHREAQEKLKKESHYMRYLLTHHRRGL